MAGLNNRLGGWIDENNGLVCRMDFFFCLSWIIL